MKGRVMSWQDSWEEKGWKRRTWGGFLRNLIDDARPGGDDVAATKKRTVIDYVRDGDSGWREVSRRTTESSGMGRGSGGRRGGGRRGGGGLFDDLLEG